MFFGNVKMALAALRSSRWRSLLTMLGIIIGVVSVVTTVSLGEGVKQQVAGQIKNLGSDLITIRPGKIVSRNPDGSVKSINIFSGLGPSTLTEQDLNVIRLTKGVKTAVPFSLVTGLAEANGREYGSGFIVATTDQAPEVLNQKVQFGAFFSSDDANSYAAVIGPRVAEELFAENVPVGKIMKIRGQDFVVRGIFEEFENNPLTPSSDFNRAIFIPLAVGKKLGGDSLQIYQVLVKPEQPGHIPAVVDSLHKGLVAAHGGQEDFTILKQEETLTIATSILNLLTAMIAGIAAISLIVGGIGIMNIMLVSVTERTREIGIRKAIGATNRQILSQFLIEAIVLSFVGGLIGIILSLLSNFVIRIATDLQPIITLPIVIIACSVSLLVGIVFGIAPALKAARKDPIDALRYE